MTTVGVSNDGETAYELVDGQWQQVTSPALAAQIQEAVDPGDTGTLGAAATTPPPAPGVPAPGGTYVPGTAPKEGDTRTVGGVMYIFRNGEWVAVAGPPAPPPGSPTLNTTVGQDPAALGPFTQYMQAMGLGAGGYRNPYQQYTANLYEPLRALYQLFQPMEQARLTGGAQGTEWADYFPGVAGGGNMRSIYGGAGQLLSQLLGMSQGARADYGMTFEPQYDPYTGNVLSQSEGGGQGMGTLQNLITLARGAGGGYTASRLPYMQQQWQLGQGQGQTGTFMDYLRTKLGM